VDLHECGSVNLVDFLAPLLCGLGLKFQGLMILIPSKLIGLQTIIGDVLEVLDCFINLR